MRVPTVAIKDVKRIYHHGACCQSSVLCPSPQVVVPWRKCTRAGGEAAIDSAGCLRPYKPGMEKERKNPRPRKKLSCTSWTIDGPAGLAGSHGSSRAYTDPFRLLPSRLTVLSGNQSDTFRSPHSALGNLFFHLVDSRLRQQQKTTLKSSLGRNAFPLALRSLIASWHLVYALPTSFSHCSMAPDNATPALPDARSESPLADGLTDQPTFQPSKPARYAYVWTGPHKNSMVDAVS